MTSIDGSMITPEILVLGLVGVTAAVCCFSLWISVQIAKDRMAGRVISDGS